MLGMVVRFEEEKNDDGVDVDGWINYDSLYNLHFTCGSYLVLSITS